MLNGKEMEQCGTSWQPKNDQTKKFQSACRMN